MEQNSKKIAAIIPAAGYSSRVGFFKPLLPTDSSLVIERSVDTFKQAGIGDIRVVIGYKADLLIPVLTRLGVKIIMNPDYDQGMYTSVQAGVRSLENNIEAFFLLPADYAFVSSETISSLLQTCDGRSFEVIYPVYQGEKGHPPLISAKLRNLIMSAEPEGGLKELLEREAHKSIEIQVDDEGILIDIDSEEDYQRAIQGMLPTYPTRKQCLELLQEHKLSKPKVEHSQVVAGISCAIAEYLNSRGYKLHLGIVMAASLLHDIAKGEKDHAGRGSQMVSRLGYPEVAEVIALHTVLDPEHRNKITETSIVYLADKLVSGHKIVSLDERLKERLNQFGEESARQGARERIGQAMAIQKQIESVLGFKFDAILDEYKCKDSDNKVSHHGSKDRTS